MNKVILMGRLCADPDFRQTQSGIAVCRIRVAIDRPYTSKSTGERQADFINVVCWRQQAEFVSRYFHKGSMIIVEGRLQNSDYTDGNGVKHYSMEVQADNVTFGETRAAAQANGNYTAIESERLSVSAAVPAAAICTAGSSTAASSSSGSAAAEQFCSDPIGRPERF